MQPLRAIGAAFKAAGQLVRMRFSRASSWLWTNLGATTQTFSRSVGDPSTNVIIGACVRWMQRTYPEAKLVVKQTQPGGEEPKTVPDHPLAALLRTPNRYYSGLLLWAATIADFALSGNAYWLKVRSGAGAVVELWWVPSDTMEPRWPQDDPTVYISHYDYTVNGQATKVLPDDVVHFRSGLDPQNTRKGRADVQSLLREIATDNEAATWTASMLRNMGVPGVLITPAAGSELQEDDAEEIKTTFLHRFTGDRRGEPMVLSAGADAKVLSFSPEQMQLREIRKIPEERITAMFGLPAIVIGMGAGLDRSTFANFAEARAAAYEGNVIPTQRLFAEELNTQLVPDFGDAATLFAEWNYADVRILQDDVNALHERARADLLAGLLTRNQALALIGEKADETPGGDVLYVPVTVMPTAPDALLAPPEPVPALPPGGTPPALPVPQAAGQLPADVKATVEELLAQRPAGLSEKAWRQIVLTVAREYAR